MPSKTPRPRRKVPRPPARPAAPRRPAPAPHDELPARPRARDAAPQTAVSRGWEIESSLLALGLLVVGLGLLGAFTGVSQAWLGAGASMIAFGIALDAYARAIGAVAAHRAGERGWVWGCALGGSPVVLAHAVVRRAGEPAVFELAPVVGLGALIVLFTLLGAAAGSRVGW